MGRPHLFWILTIALCLGACESEEGESPQDPIGLIKNNPINVMGIERTYDLYLPAQTEDSPLVFLLHGNGSNADNLMGGDGNNAPYEVWLQLARDENIVLAIPQGARGLNDRRGWNDCRVDGIGNPSTNDTQFINALLDFLVDEYQLDPSRVYAMGSSNGGHMIYRLSQEIPEKLAAISMVIASSPANSNCVDANTPLSVLIMNGVEDPILPYNGGPMASNRGEVLSTQASINYWVNRNQTNPLPDSLSFPDINPNDKSTITRFLYSGGVNDTEVALYRMDGAGHAEPSITEEYSFFFQLIVGQQNRDLEMANEVWAFFRDKSAN